MSGVKRKGVRATSMCTTEEKVESSAGSNGMERLERLEIERYRKELGKQIGRDLSFEEAKTLWNANCAAEWRASWMRDFLAKQREEILKHKWIESEKAQRDLGAEAVFDWINRYAAAWRIAYEREQEKRLREHDQSKTTTPQ